MADLTDKLTAAFRELRKRGFFARRNFWCCQSCGWSAVPATNRLGHPFAGVVFYHAQDAEQLEKSGECYLAWSGDGHQIVRILNQFGINTEWDGEKATRILVKESNG